MSQAHRSELTRNVIVFVIALALAVVSIPKHVTAVALAPGVLELKGKRGDVVESSFTLINTQPEERTYFLSTMKFEQRSEAGGPQFIPFEQDHTGLPEWVLFPHKSVAVPPQSKLNVPFSIVIPSGADGGSHHGAIVVSETPFDVVEANGVNVNAMTAALVFLTIDGTTQEKAAVLDFLSSQAGRLKASATGAFKYRVQNQGNVFVVPDGAVRVRDVFGREVAYGDANAKDGRVLPGTTRLFEGTFNQTSGVVFGPVTAALEVNYGEGNEPLVAEFSFWVISWKPLLVILAVLIALPLILRRKN